MFLQARIWVGEVLNRMRGSHAANLAPKTIFALGITDIGTIIAFEERILKYSPARTLRKQYLFCWVARNKSFVIP